MFNTREEHEKMLQTIRTEIEAALSVGVTKHALDHEFESHMRKLLDLQEQERRDEQADRRRVRRRALWAIAVALLGGSGGASLVINWDQLPAALTLLIGG